MNKKIVAVAMFAAFATSTVNAAEIFNQNGNKLDLYGKVKGEHDFSSSDENHDATYARLGFKGETQVNDAVTGYGHFEHQFNASQAEGSQGAGKTRLAFAGIKVNEYGSIDYGRNYGIVYDIGSYADNLTEFGGDSYQFTDNYMNGRGNGLLTYRTSDGWGVIEGVEFGLQYQGANEDRALKSNGEGFGTSLQYTVADLTLGGAYSHAKTTDATYGSGKRIATAENADAWTVGMKYTPGALYMAATYAETRNMTPFTLNSTPLFLDKTENIEAMAAYTFSVGLTPSVGFVQSAGYFDGQSIKLTKYIQMGAAYNFNRNLKVDVGYKFNLLDNEVEHYGIANDNQAIFGVTYQF